MSHSKRKTIPVLLNWALLALGAGQISLVLIGPALYLLSTISVVILLVVYLARLEPGMNHRAIFRKILIVSLMLATLTSVYNYLVLLDVQRQLLLLNVAGIAGACAMAHITALFVNVKYVTR